MKGLLQKSAIALMPFALFMQGCSQDSLEAVASLEPTVTEITQKGNAVIQDISETCVRGKEVSFSNEALLLDEHSDEFVPILVADGCASSREQAIAVERLNNTFALYINSLVKLASNQTVTFDESLTTLGTSVGATAELLGITIAPSTIEESAGLANSLLNLWSTKFRRDELTGVLICTNGSMQQFAQLLDQAVQDAYIDGGLADEKRAIAKNVRTRYRLAYNQLNAGEMETNAFIQFNSDLKNEYARLSQDIAQREQTVREYQQILARTMKTHQSLADLFAGDMSAAAVSDLCQAYGTVEASATSEAGASGASADEASVSEEESLLPEVSASKLLQGKEILDQHARDVKEIVAVK